MKQNLVCKASGIAVVMALSTFAVPTMAQNYSPAADERVWSLPQTDTTPSEQPILPRGSEEQLDMRPSGAQGPIRSDDATQYGDSAGYSGTRRERMRSFLHRPVGDGGYVGFLQWSEKGTNSP